MPSPTLLLGAVPSLVKGAYLLANKPKHEDYRMPKMEEAYSRMIANNQADITNRTLLNQTTSSAKSLGARLYQQSQRGLNIGYERGMMTEGQLAQGLLQAGTGIQEKVGEQQQQALLAQHQASQQSKDRLESARVELGLLKDQAEHSYKAATQQWKAELFGVGMDLATIGANMAAASWQDKNNAKYIQDLAQRFGKPFEELTDDELQTIGAELTLKSHGFDVNKYWKVPEGGWPSRETPSGGSGGGGTKLIDTGGGGGGGAPLIPTIDTTAFNNVWNAIPDKYKEWHGDSVDMKGLVEHLMAENPNADAATIQKMIDDYHDYPRRFATPEYALFSTESAAHSDKTPGGVWDDVNKTFAPSEWMYTRSGGAASVAGTLGTLYPDYKLIDPYTKEAQDPKLVNFKWYLENAPQSVTVPGEDRVLRATSGRYDVEGYTKKYPRRREVYKQAVEYAQKYDIPPDDPRMEKFFEERKGSYDPNVGGYKTWLNDITANKLFTAGETHQTLDEAWYKIPENLRLQYGADYDLVAWAYSELLNDPKANLADSLQNGAHLPDTFKLPSHPTFSVDSKFSDEYTPGGVWDENNQTFTPSEWMLKRRGGIDDILYALAVGDPEYKLKHPVTGELIDPVEALNLDTNKQLIGQQEAADTKDTKPLLSEPPEAETSESKPLISDTGEQAGRINVLDTKTPEERAEIEKLQGKKSQADITQAIVDGAGKGDSPEWKKVQQDIAKDRKKIYGKWKTGASKEQYEENLIHLNLGEPPEVTHDDIKAALIRNKIAKRKVYTWDKYSDEVAKTGYFNDKSDDMLVAYVEHNNDPDIDKFVRSGEGGTLEVFIRSPKNYYAKQEFEITKDGWHFILNGKYYPIFKDYKK